jgi:hypothetical protein
MKAENYRSDRVRADKETLNELFLDFLQRR